MNENLAAAIAKLVPVLRSLDQADVAEVLRHKSITSEYPDRILRCVADRCDTQLGRCPVDRAVLFAVVKQAAQSIGMAVLAPAEYTHAIAHYVAVAMRLLETVETELARLQDEAGHWR